ncbi:hypothetical protein R3P38DRAFT_2811603 [Favolaschia claudopus]|uniref:Uncharacterized protein n=1 Tax=Favolaschia claudopus TaxID=2862362 RepID=A0AAV9Z8N4_9AGAR
MTNFVSRKVGQIERLSTLHMYITVTTLYCNSVVYTHRVPTECCREVEALGGEVDLGLKLLPFMVVEVTSRSGDQQHIELTWVGSGDAGYEAVPSRRAALMALGKISFRTCFRTARIPVSYLNHLASQSYPAKDKDGNETEPFTLQQAIDHWLLVEILGGIGDHSMKFATLERKVAEPPGNDEMTLKESFASESY